MIGGPVPDQGLFDLLSERPIIAVPVRAGAASQVLVNRVGMLVGRAFKNTGAAAYVADLLDGQDANGMELAAVTLAANSGEPPFLSDLGPVFRNGLFLNFVSGGNLVGAVWVRL